MVRFESRAHWLLSACLLLGCSRHDDAQGASPGTEGERAETPNPDPSADPSPIVEFTEPYPAGHWRLVDQKDLGRVMLWCSHILIRHRDVPPGMVSFHSPHWWGAPPAPARSRAEAFALAQQVAARLTEHPERFAELARTYSEDIATRDVGGDEGGVQASQVRQPVFLDVLATLRPGEISRVFESGYGFHILMRRAPPEERTVSGSHIVFAHDDAPWVQRFLPRPGHAQGRRSKAQALALAEQVYAEAKQNPSAFATLVERYTDHEDASRGGDFGAWSSREPTPFRREVSTLLRLKVGEVAPPLDTLFGVQIIQRTEDRPRVVYTSSSIQRSFNPDAPATGPQSEASVRQGMTALADSLRLDPDRFERLPPECCRAQQKTWLAGTELARYESPLERLLPGQITEQPFKDLNTYVISKRLNPAPLAKPSVVFELPAPAHREPAALVELAGISVWQWVAARIEKELPLDAATRAQLASLAQPSDAEAQSPDSVAVFNAVQARVRDLLGPRYPEYLDRLRDGLEAFQLDNSPEYRLGVSSAPEGFFASNPNPAAP